MKDFICEGSVCRVVGSLSQQDVVELWDKRKRLLNEQVKVIDLSELNYSDSAGIAFLLELVSLAKQRGRALSLTSVPAQLAKLVALYDLELFFNEDIAQGK